MNDGLLYILQVILIQSVLSLLYCAIYQRHTFYQLRRFYLLGGVIFSFILPELIHLVQFPSEMIYSITLDPVLVTASGAVPVSQIIEDQFNWMIIIYTVGLLVVALSFVYAISRIIKVLLESRFVQEPEVQFCIHPRFKMPASFLGYVLLNEDHYNRKDAIASIIEHELEHIRQRHSWDLLFLAIIKIVLWMSPAIWWISAEIKRIHEYQADQKATGSDGVSVSNYCKELFNAVFDEKPQLIHSFSSPNIKNRIMQLKKKKSNGISIWTYTLVIPTLLLAGLFIQSCNESVEPEVNTEVAQDVYSENANVVADRMEQAQSDNIDTDDEDIYKVVEQMPRFPGCEDELGDDLSKKNCANKKMLEFIYKNVKYPKEARKEGIEGTTVVRFVIDKDGRVKDEELARDLGGGCGAESIRVVRLMQEQNIVWEPGVQKGKRVNVQFNLPIKFRLE